MALCAAAMAVLSSRICHASLKSAVDVKSSGLMQCSSSLTFMVIPAGCSPVAAELNHCEHGRHSLFTCGLSPAAAQPGYTGICS